MKWLLIIILGLIMINTAQARVTEVENRLNGSMSINGNNFLIQVDNINYTLKPYAVVNNRYYTFDDLTANQLRNLGTKYNLTKTETGYKFSYSFTKQLVVTEVGFAYSGFEYGEDYIFNDKVYIDFIDLLQHNYSVKINATNIRITNLKNGFNDLDPLVTFQSANNLGTDNCDFTLGCDGVITNTLPLAKNVNPIFFISVNYAINTGTTYITSIDYGGVILPQWYSITNFGSGVMDIYYYVGNMTANTSNILTITFANDGTSAFQDSIQALQFYNVNQTDPYLSIKTSNGVTSPVKCLINGTNQNNILIDFVMAYRGSTTLSLTPHSLQTANYNTNFGVPIIRQSIASSRKYGNITSKQNNMSWTESTNRDWVSLCSELRFFNDTAVTPSSNICSDDRNMTLGFTNKTLNNYVVLSSCVSNNTLFIPSFSRYNNIFYPLLNQSGGLILKRI